MKTITKSLGVGVLIVTLGCNAFADGGRGYSYSSQHRHYQNHQGRSLDSGWVAPLLFLGLAGAVIGAASSQPRAPEPVYVQPAPVTYAPPVVAYPAPVAVTPMPSPAPAGVWYFCKSVGQYYPYTQYCPEGWTPVLPAPQ